LESVREESEIAKVSMERSHASGETIVVEGGVLQSKADVLANKHTTA
jgi:hypothetical protein